MGKDDMNNLEFELNGSVSLSDITKNLFLISFIY